MARLARHDRGAAVARLCPAASHRTLHHHYCHRPLLQPVYPALAAATATAQINTEAQCDGLGRPPWPPWTASRAAADPTTGSTHCPPRWTHRWTLDSWTLSSCPVVQPISTQPSDRVSRKLYLAHTTHQIQVTAFCLACHLTI